MTVEIKIRPPCGEEDEKTIGAHRARHRGAAGSAGMADCRRFRDSEAEDIAGTCGSAPSASRKAMR